MSFLPMGKPRLAVQNPSGSIASKYWAGQGADAGYFVYQFGSNWVMSKQLGPGWKSDAGDLLIPRYALVDGSIVFESSGYYLFKDLTFGWIIKPNLAPAYEAWVCEDEDDPDAGGHYQGAEFWAGGELSDGSSFKERGFGRGETEGAYEGSEITIEPYFPRFECRDQFGEFEGKGEGDYDSGTKLFGVPQWKNGDAKYPRSAVKGSASGKYSYGDILWSDAASAYVLGSYGSESGWWQASNPPNAGSSWTLQFTVPEGSELTGDNLTLEWDAWVEGSTKADLQLLNAIGFQS